ncbi:MAG: tripartite tricarboxylate transporter substrate binding protein [Comamonadaceae bacterium]|nr:MAG: tripartite tricarboxylate transporter substrate binding protein [Comamonadaceae bacterium]
MTQQWLRKSPRLSLLAIALSGASMAHASQPQAYPDRMIRLVVPFTAGGSSDVQARMLADRLGKLYNQAVVVENRPGAGGHIGGKYVVDAPADGYTLLLGSIGLHATYKIFKKLSYDPATDLKVITVLAEMPHVVVVNPAVAANDLKELAALARKQPDTINFGSAGVGSSVHMIGELFKLTAAAPIVHVPYKGSTAALNDLLAGQIETMFDNPPTTLAYIRSGKLKALAVTGKTRLPALAQVPTAIESGFPAFEATSWTTIAVSAKVPDAIADKLNADIRKIVEAPEFRKGLAEQGMTPVATARDAATRFIAAEKVRWDKVIDDGRLTAE